MPGYLQLVQMSNWGQGDVRAQALSCCVKQVAGSSAFHIYNWCFQARGDENKMGLISLLCLMDRTIITFRFRAKTLKRRHMVLIIRLTVYFELLLTICFNVKKKKTHAKCCCSVLPPLSETLCFSSCLFKAPPSEYPVCSDWSAHARLTQHDRAVINQLLRAKLATWHKLCKFVTWLM